MKKSTTSISTLVAVSGSLVALPAAALELGEAQIKSSLGQTLQADIAYALAPNETLASTCISTQFGQPGSAASKTGASKISIANGIISAIKEIGVEVPIVVRLEGTNVNEGKKILNESGLAVISADNLDDAANKAVAAVGA